MADRKKDTSRLITVCADQVQMKPVKWLWPGRFAIGKLTLVAGEPGLGKSQLAIDIAARVTHGAPWPLDEGAAPQGSVIILSAEDGAEDTIVPRLIAAGADLNKVHIVEAVRRNDGKVHLFDLSKHLVELEALVTELGDVRLIVIDPISAYLGKIESHSNTEVRGVLEPVGKLAEELDVAILAITHPPKTTNGKANNAFIGSVAFVAAARAAFLVIRDQTDPEKRLFLNSKNNLAPTATGLSFHLKQCDLHDGIIASRVVWHDEYSDITADEAMQRSEADPPPREKARTSSKKSCPMVPCLPRSWSIMPESRALRSGH